MRYLNRTDFRLKINLKSIWDNIDVAICVNIDHGTSKLIIRTACEYQNDFPNRFTKKNALSWFKTNVCRYHPHFIKKSVIHHFEADDPLIALGTFSNSKNSLETMES